MRRLGVAAMVFAAGAAAAAIQSDWERENEDKLKQSEETFVAPPPYDRARRVELKLAATPETDFRYYVDPRSVSVAADRIVRYVLVARSSGGVENVSFEGIRCPGEYRIYAVGRPDGSWAGRPTSWRPIPRDARVSQNALARKYFCPARQAVENAAEAEQALRAGGHPHLKQD